MSSSFIERKKQTQQFKQLLVDYENNKHTYRLNFYNKSSLDEFKEKLKNNSNIEKINATIN